MTFGFHPYANLFPLLEQRELLELAEDIRVRGVIDRIDIIETNGIDQILDGRNRYRALAWLVSTGEVLGEGWGAQRAGTALYPEDLVHPTPAGLPTLFNRFNEKYDGDPLSYVLSKNLKRRHLDESQRAMVAARLANMGHGGNRSKPPIGGLNTEAAALALNVGTRSIERARVVQDRAAPEIVEAVDRGQIPVSVAAEVAAQAPERQAEIVAALPRDESGKLTPEAKKALAPVIREIRAEKVAAKRERRASREETWGRKLQDLPEKQFGVAIEDFEWHHDTWSSETGIERHPSMHYETAADAQTPEEIVARCAERFACLADDCILFKWSTIPHLAIALRTLELQGFRYVTHLVWNKERVGEARGHGYWFTGEHEIVLVGVRGDVVAPATAHFRSAFSAPVGEHSEKPDNLHEIIEYHWPSVPKVEFNARRSRPGWKTWGFDAPAASSEAEVVAIGAAPSPARSSLRQLLEGADYRPSTNDEIADGGEAIHAAESPAPPAPDDSLPEASGTVDPSVASDAELPAPEARTDEAEPPANRPGLPVLEVVASEPEEDRSIETLCFIMEGTSPRGESAQLEIPQFLGWPEERKQHDQVQPNVDRAPPEIVDGALQVRLPLTADELEIQQALLAVLAGKDIARDMVRHLIGGGYATLDDDLLVITTEGRTFLAQLPDVPQEAAE